MTRNNGQDPSETLEVIGQRMYRGRNDDLTTRATRVYGGTADAVYISESREPEVLPAPGRGPWPLAGRRGGRGGTGRYRPPYF